MKNGIKSFEDLVVWKKAHNIVLITYKLLEKFPKEEKYRIIDQLVRAVVSIPTNISEGFGRYTNKDYIHFLIIASGSLSEVETQIIISQALNFVNEMEFENTINEINEIRAQLFGLIKYVNKNK